MNSLLSHSLWVSLVHSLIYFNYRLFPVFIYSFINGQDKPANVPGTPHLMVATRPEVGCFFLLCSGQKWKSLRLVACLRSYAWLVADAGFASLFFWSLSSGGNASWGVEGKKCVPPLVPILPQDQLYILETSNNPFCSNQIEFWPFSLSLSKKRILNCSHKIKGIVKRTMLFLFSSYYEKLK